MMKSASSLVLIAVMSLAAASCNKDDIIESPADESEGTFRQPEESSSRYSATVYDYTPAPGQFINEKATGGMLSDILTMEEACRWAQQRLDKNLFVSLGGFGGYIVVGFDHSIPSSDGDYDFAVAGNAFLSVNGASNEPGVVYVMQDANGNGLPDDTWFELRGSEYDSETTVRDYSVTYYRPSGPGAIVEWTDNLGNRGFIDYLFAYHKQDSYYPAWISENSYTLSGTCLEPRNVRDQATGLWSNNEYAWGYADNVGTDNTAIGALKQCNRFRISDAVTANGEKAGLKYIDFIKVQTGVNSKSGLLGEISTEIFGFIDLHL